MFFNRSVDFYEYACMKSCQKRPYSKTILVSIMLLLLLTLIAIVLGLAESSNAMHIAPITLEKTLRKSEKFLLLDVRSKAEYDRGHIVGAIHVPFWAPWRITSLLSQHISPATQPNTSAAPLIIYCELGPRAGLVGLWLRLTGATEYAYLEGHMSHWRQLDLPTAPNAAAR
jgi:rhodanese-related sulfurtransferase